MRYEQLLYVTEIAKTNSMRKASENLYITQPAISEAINSLERLLGYALFERSRKGVTLTAQGKMALPIIEEIIKSTRELQKIALQAPDLEISSASGSIIVHTTPYLMNDILQDVIIKFSEYYPNFFIHTKETNYEQILCSMESNVSDIGLLSGPSAIIKSLKFNEDIQKKILYDIPMHVIINNDSPYSKSDTFSLKHINQNHKIALASYDLKECTHGLSIQFDGYVIPSIQLLCQNLMLVFNKISINPDYISFLYTNNPIQYAKQYDFYAKNIKILPVKEKKTMTGLLIYRKEQLANEAFCNFIKLMEAKINKNSIENVANNLNLF